MEQSTAQRRLVKSPPELWAEVSSEDALSRHLAQFGEIRITRLQPETTVAWEGDRASGTVQLESTGWGTKVTLSVTAEEQPAPEPEPEPLAVERGEDHVHTSSFVPQARDEPRRGFFARLFRRRTPDLAPAPAAAPVLGPPAPDPEPPPPEPDPAPTASRPELDNAGTIALLTEILDDLGAAHHRPFSRG